MGDKKKKRARFLEQHPFCCFCGGETPATTIDHIPARTCFKGRAYPDEFEFPACEPCNAASRKDEIAFSFYVRMLDQTSENADGSEARKAIAALANNLPHLVPTVPDAMAIRHGLKRMGLRAAPGVALKDLPMLGLPFEANEYLNRYARKIAVALFYKEKGRPAPLDYQVLMDWGQQGDRSFTQRVEGFMNLPDLRVGTRKNLNFGNQLSYRSITPENPDAFVTIVRFSTGMALAGMTVSPETAERLTADAAEIGSPPNSNPWVAVRDIYPHLREPPVD